MRIMSLYESELGNREPLEDILKEKGMTFLTDQSQVEEKLNELGASKLIGTAKAIVTMTDADELEMSVWVMETETPTLKDLVRRIK